MEAPKQINAEPTAEQDKTMEVDSWKHLFLAAGFGEEAARKYTDLFLKHEIDLPMLADLTHPVLESMGIWKAGHRIKILRMQRLIYSAQQGQIVEDENDKRTHADTFIFSRKTFPPPIEPKPAHEERKDKRRSVGPTISPAAQASAAAVKAPAAHKVVHKRVLAPGSVVEVSSADESDSYDSDPEEVVYIRRSSVGAQQAASRIGISSSSENATVLPGSSAIPIQSRKNILVTEEVSGSWDGHNYVGSTPPASSFMHYARNPMSNSFTNVVDMEGSYGPNNGMDASAEFSGTPPSLNASSSLGKNAPSSRSVSLTASPAGAHETAIRYFFNDDVVKHRLRVSSNDINVSKFAGLVRQAHKLPGDDFAVFSYDNDDGKLRIVKEASLREDDIYYVIENSKMDKLFKKIEDRVKKNATMAMSDNKGRAVWTSDNNPMKVDFVPETEILMNQMGRIGLCMAPGRKKKKAHHDWDRDLDKDLDRIQKAYGCHVFVSLIRNSEMVALKIPNLFEEVEKRGMESIHFPIKDKWIPNSMDGLIALVDTLIQRLKEGKTIVIHCNGGKGRSATVAVAILIGLGKKVQNSIEVVRKARSGTIRNPLQIMYVKRFKKAWKAFQKKRMSKGAGKDSDSDTDLTDDSTDGDLSIDEDSFKHDEDDISGTDADKRELKRQKQEEEKKAKELKKQAEREREEAKKREKEAKKEEEKRKEEAKKEEEKRKKEEKQQKKEEEKLRKDEQSPAAGSASTTKPEDAKTPNPQKEKKRTAESLTSADDTGSGTEPAREKKTFVKKGKDEPVAKAGKSPMKVDIDAASSAAASPEPEAPTTPSRSRRKLVDEPMTSEPSSSGAVESAPAPSPSDAEEKKEKKKKHNSVEPPAEVSV